MEEVRVAIPSICGQMITVRPCAAGCAPVLIVSCRQSLVALIYASGREFAFPLDLHPMEPVSETVLQALRTVGYGKTITHGELAALNGTGVPARAIGRSWRPPQCRSTCRATAWSPAMDSVDIPAASPAGVWRLSAGCWRT
jgi:hypothetical protein